MTLIKEALLCKNWQKAREKTILATIITKGHLDVNGNKENKTEALKIFLTAEC